MTNDGVPELERFKINHCVALLEHGMNHHYSIGISIHMSPNMIVPHFFSCSVARYDGLLPHR